MKQLVISVFIIMSICGLYSQDLQPNPIDTAKAEAMPSTGKLSDIQGRAQMAYQDGDFRKAISLLESEIDALKKGRYVSPEMYYNLANAYFRVNDFSKAILNYERAQLYNPGDRDLKHNVEYARTKIEDKILTADNFFLWIWFDGIQNLLPSDSWARVSIVFFVLFIGSLFLYFFNSKLILKKIGFYAGIVLFVLLIFTNIFAFNQKAKIENRNTAIVMAASAHVVSSPNTTSKELFTLHAGTKVVITKNDGGWYEIEIANGSVGWIQKDKVEII